MAARNASSNAAGRAAEPLVTRRSARARAPQRVRVAGSAPRQASISFAYIVGTAMNSVASPNASQIAAASNGAKRTVAPIQRAPSNATISPCVWCSGSTCRSRSSRRHRHASSSAVTVAASAA